MSHPKVVALSTASKKTSPLPPVVHTLRQHSRKQLLVLLESLFNNADDALFEMADRSRSDTDQHLYFESMRELRLRRETVRESFSRLYSEGFSSAFTTPNESDEANADTNFDQVSLLNNDELEMSVAVAGIASKVTSQYSLLIMQLTKRLDHLTPHLEVTERSNPMGPDRISQSFVAALECAELDIKVRIILLKLFERFVMERLAGMYTEANQMLADAGVLAELKSTMRRDRKRTASTAPEKHGVRDAEDQTGGLYPSSSYGSGGAGSDSGRSGGPSGLGFELIQELLAGSRGGLSSEASPSEYSGSPLSTADVLTVLANAQSELTDPIDIEAVPRALDLRQLVLTNAGRSGGSASRLTQADDDVVHFVGMLFDYILNDRNLAIPMKALIGRLQLPIVRLAVMDRSFFDRGSHPARQLLNELSSAGIGWSSARELKRDSMYNKIESVVLRVVNDFKADPAVFEALLDELRVFVKKDRSKRDQVEQRVKDNEKGRARTINAKQAAQKLINQKASGMRLPPELGRFISDTWSKVLVYTCIKHGDRSSAWHTQAEILDRLIWCLQPLDKLEDMTRRDEMLPALLDDLRQGMGQVQLPEPEISRRLEEIQTHLTSISANDRAYIDEDDPVPSDESYEVMDEVVLTLPGEQLDHQPQAEVEADFIEQIGKLREGSWVELLQPSGELLRCKLSTITDPGGRYIFVNRRGMKVAERSRRGLAIELKRKNLTILAESQVFDRALQAVIGNLRQMHRGSSNPS